MTDLNYIWLDFDCPNCHYQDQFQLLNAKTESTIFCHNCKVAIQLIDSDASAHTSIEKINKAFDDLENLFKKF